MNINYGDIDFWKNFAILLGVIVSIHSLLKSVSEYSKQGTQKRADYFFNLQKRFKENEIFGDICSGWTKSILTSMILAPVIECFLLVFMKKSQLQ